MKKFLALLIFLFAFVNTCIIGQNKLIFVNKKTSEKIEIETSDYVKIEYRGYLNQKQSVKNYVSSIYDSFITVVNNSDKEIKNDFFKIEGQDITGFRKMKIQPFIKPVANLSLTVGSYFFFENNKNISQGEAILYSLGTGIAFNFILDFLFPEDIEYRISEGWSLKFSSSINPN